MPVDQPAILLLDAASVRLDTPVTDVNAVRCM